MKIRQDHSRFREIIRGRIKRDLRKYMSNGDMVARHGEKTIKIPISRIDIPRFKLGSSESEGQGQGVGQGDGEVGDPVDGSPEDGESGAGEAGSNEGDKQLEHEISIEELAQIMAEELELPRIEPKGAKEVNTTSIKYSGLSPTGPESLRSFKKTYQRALLRQVSSGTYDPTDPVIVPRREDRRYRSWKEDIQPVTNAVIIYMMDVSGSMGDEQKEIVRMTSFWLDTWLSTQYKGLEARYIIHDASAREVDRETFFHTRESGGTMISSAYRTCLDIMRADYPSNEWNIYPFHFSDGDNWSLDDTSKCMNLLEHDILPNVNMFSYGQVVSAYGSGQFLKDLEEKFPNDERVALTEIKDRTVIYDGIRDFLGRGR
ncbi:MAG: uncharacterized sporulation protein YeaH/YhbH (DUF444 family) [Bradymonadia bacterium]|jgi:uncharacterized sporulation protein YeaH/YhbH (DUF444 family)